MAGAVKPANERSAVGRVSGHVVGYVRGAPRWMRLTAAAALIAGVAALGYWAVERRSKSRAHAAYVTAMTKFNEALLVGDRDKMDEALAEAEAARPDDPTAVARREAVRTGNAPANAPDMLAITLRQALRANDLPTAEREADKLLVHAPRDWLARCSKVAAALARNDRPAADAELAKLGDPNDKGTGINPGTLAFSFDLFKRVGRDPSALRAFIVANVTRMMKTPAVQGLPPGDRLGFVECYLKGFEPSPQAPQVPPLVESYSPARSLVAGAAADAAGDVVVLTRVARLGADLIAATGLLRAHNQITAEQEADFTKEDVERTKTAWEAVLAANPKTPEAHRGLAITLARRGDYPAARAALGRGLAACPDEPMLAELFSRVLQLEGNAIGAFNALRDTARRTKDQPVWWQLAADAAVAGNRRDLALAACREFRAARPGDPWGVRSEAKLLLDGGDAAAAAALLFPLGNAGLASDPATLRLYVRALAEAGLSAKVGPVIADAEAEAATKNTSVPVIAAVRGLLEAAPPDGARAATAAARSAAGLERFSDDTVLLGLHAEALYRVAELANWPAEAVAAAVRAGERHRAKVPADRGTAYRLAMLRVYGDPNPEQAYRDAAPIRDAESDPTLTASDLELLGQVFRRTGRTADAVRVLTRATQAFAAPAGSFTQLALAHHAAGRDPEAKAALARAQALPRNPREQADYAAAAALLHREKTSP